MLIKTNLHEFCEYWLACHPPNGKFTSTCLWAILDKILLFMPRSKMRMQTEIPHFPHYHQLLLLFMIWTKSKCMQSFINISNQYFKLSRSSAQDNHQPNTCWGCTENLRGKLFLCMWYTYTVLPINTPLLTAFQLHKAINTWDSCSEDLIHKKLTGLSADFISAPQKKSRWALWDTLSLSLHICQSFHHCL